MDGSAGPRPEALPNMPDTTLRLESVSQVFHRGTANEVQALDHVDLELDRGSFSVVLGTNGSGKSSLLNAIAGSLAIAGGQVYLDGREVTHWPEHRRARLLSRVFQNPFSGTASDLSVAENLVLAGRRGGQRWLRLGLGRQRRSAIREQVAQLGMGLEDRLDIPIGMLSGGQRQALTVLMATMVRPSLLLLDEHTAALDPRSAEQVVRLTQRAIMAGGLTTLMVTHSMSQAVQLGDRILVMHRGRLVYDLRDIRRGRLSQDDLLQLFDQLRWADRLDESAAEMLRRAYV
jgi:putative ABC transport system ATP-binding protein